MSHVTSERPVAPQPLGLAEAPFEPAKFQRQLTVATLGLLFVVLLIYVAIQQIEGHLVTPNVMRTQTDVRPASVIVALTVGYTLGGLLGALAAIPIFAAARVLVLRVLVPSIRRSSFADRA